MNTWLGTMTFGAQTARKDAARMVDLCLERGVHHFDTANSYAGGKSEEILGELVRGRRDRVVLASKVFNRMGDAPDQAGLSAPAIRRAIEGSLRRLGTDYLDVYYLHHPDPKVPIAETLEAMDTLVREGKVRAVGASNYASWQLVQMIELAKANGWRPITLVQCMYSLIARRPDDELLPMCRAYGLTSVAYNPLAGGLLTGKHKPEAPIAGTRFDGNQMYLDRYWTPGIFDAVAALARTAHEAKRTLVGLSLAWLAHHAGVDALILGASSVEQLIQNLDALAEGPLPGDVVAACDDVGKNLRGPSPHYIR